MTTSKETKHSFGGLQISNQDQISHTLFCELCKLLLFKPTQILCCGARLCQWCSKRGLSNSEPFICPFCHIEQSKKQVLMDCGIERELNMIKVDCYSCSWNGSYKDYQKHLQEQHADFECSDCHTRFFTINSFEEHRQEICEYRLVLCGLPGCINPVKLREIHAHLLSDNHQNLLYKIIFPYLPSKKLAPYYSNLVINTVNGVRNKVDGSTGIEKSVNTPSSILATLLNDFTRLKSEHDQRNQGSESTISSLKNVRLLNDNGSMIFSFNRHRDEINSPFSINSPKFKTSPYGYLFMLRVCSTLNSTDENQGYLSVYITLLRGDFDPVLFYPFPYNIFLYLYDQSGHGKHIVSTIVPDPTSSSFARPISEKNDEIGIIKFCRLSCLTDAQSLYLKNNVFLIGIHIDFMNNGLNPF